MAHVWFPVLARLFPPRGDAPKLTDLYDTQFKTKLTTRGRAMAFRASSLLSPALLWPLVKLNAVVFLCEAGFGAPMAQVRFPVIDRLFPMPDRDDGRRRGRRGNAHARGAQTHTHTHAHAHTHSLSLSLTHTHTHTHTATPVRQGSARRWRTFGSRC